jgi:hypothetical protein
MVAQHHADRGVKQLGLDAVAVLVGEAGGRVPAAAMQLLEFGAAHLQILGVLASGGDQPHGDRLVEAVDDEGVAELLGAHQMRRALAELGIDEVEIAVGRLGYVRIRRYRLCCHGFSRGAGGRAPTRRPF